MTTRELAELRAVIRQELEEAEERRRRGQSMLQRVLEPYETAIEAFDYEETQTGQRPDGSVYILREPHKYRLAVRTALSTLLRTAFGARRRGMLPPEHEEAMGRFVGDVLALMQAYRAEARPDQKAG